MTGIKEEPVETAETIKAIETIGGDKDGEKSKDEYLENLAQLPCIWYSITF